MRVSAASGRESGAIVPPDAAQPRFRELPAGAQDLVLAVFSVGLLAAVTALVLQPPVFDRQTILLLALAVAGSLLRVPLPFVGRLSLAYPFVFGSLMAFGLGASCLAGVLSAAAGTLVPDGTRRQPVYRLFFNVGTVGLSATIAGALYLTVGGHVGAVNPLRNLEPILAYTGSFAILNLGLVSLVGRFAGRERAMRSLKRNLAWSVPGFLAGSSCAALLGFVLQREDLSLFLLTAPLVYLIDVAYRARAEKAEQAQQHSQKAAELYEAVTRALALSIEAKDENTEDHLRRVQRLCLGIGERLGLPPPEMEALRAAALLHDIGKIAVPEYILTKPGRLTPDEMEKMRVHPIVGAQILSAVPFPYPLAPIVRHHHERWDGNGYPDRIAGIAIPLGARILTLVDCYDALTTDRPYRKSVSRVEATKHLRREAGRIFDPHLVDLFLANVDEFEGEACSKPGAAVRAPEDEAVGATEGGSPAFGRAESAADALEGESQVRTRVEIETLNDLARTLGHQLDLDETLTLQAAKLRRVVPYRSLVVYLHDDDQTHLVARFAAGTAAERLKGHRIPLGERLSGWAALHQRAYIGREHFNPMERDGSRSDLEDLATDPEAAELRSAVVAPMSTEQQSLGVLAVYDVAERLYTPEHRRFLLLAAQHFAEAVRNALVFERESRRSLTDPLTGVPNWRFYFLHADRRISERADDRASGGVGVLAFRVEGLQQVRELYGSPAADRLLGNVARRLAHACEPGETVMRMGGDLFLVLTGEWRPRLLNERTLRFLQAAQNEPAEIHPNVFQSVRLMATHAAFPTDGDHPDQLLHVLEGRLEEACLQGTAVVAFPTGRWESRAGVR